LIQRSINIVKPYAYSVHTSQIDHYITSKTILMIRRLVFLCLPLLNYTPPSQPSLGVLLHLRHFSIILKWDHPNFLSNDCISKFIFLFLVTAQNCNSIEYCSPISLSGTFNKLTLKTSLHSIHPIWILG
jgi:hypothetical protein